MSDRWTDRLSEYLDGELTADEARELEAHLAGCGECRAVVAGLRQVVDRAALLRDRPPAGDLWAGIAERIREEPPEVRVVSLFDAKRGRRVSFSVPQLLAAGLVLALASAGSVWMALRGGGAVAAGPVAVAPVEVTRAAPGRTEEPVPSTGESRDDERPGTAPPEAAPAEASPGSPAPSAGRAAEGRGTRAVPPPEAPSRFAAYSDPAYDAAVADLQAVLEQGRDRLDPRTVQVLEESLRTIDAAIEDARGALAEDPANARLNTYLAGTMQRKLDLLREASSIVTATI